MILKITGNQEESVSKYDSLLKSKMSEESYRKLANLGNEKVIEFIGEFTEHCDPNTVYVCDDSREDEDYVRRMALEKKEEFKLAKDGQTIHWDSYGDQARDKKNTKYLVYKENLEKMKSLNATMLQK